MSERASTELRKKKSVIQHSNSTSNNDHDHWESPIPVPTYLFFTQVFKLQTITFVNHFLRFTLEC